MNPIFFETGTHKGGGVNLALKCGFPYIVSLEILSKFHEAAEEKFSERIAEGRIRLVQGDSGKVFGNEIAKLKSVATFWLDAHKRQTTLYKELHALKEAGVTGHTVLIDDVRMFGPDGNGWGKGVTKEEIERLLREINPDYQITLEDSRRYEKDIMVACPFKR